MSDAILGLYIHIPFCKHMCRYCDFYKLVNLNYKNDFITALCQDIKAHAGDLTNIQSIYVGGGTPTILSLEDWSHIINALKETPINLKALKEFSIEANPSDITDEFVQGIVQCGVTRVSLGIQSLNTEKLQIMGRSHTKAQALEAIHLLKKYSLSVNVDLIYGFERDTFESIQSDIEACLQAGCDSFSLYTLILEEHTALYLDYQKGRFKTLSDEEEHELYYKVHDYLEQKSFFQYEISNYAKKGYESFHNLLYWHYKSFLGLGPASSSLIGSRRLTVESNIKRYNQGIIRYQENLPLSDLDQMTEYVMMGLRLVAGIYTKDFEKQFKTSIFTVFPKIKSHLTNHTLILDNDYLRIPLEYLYVENAILTDILFN